MKTLLLSFILLSPIANAASLQFCFGEGQQFTNCVNLNYSRIKREVHFTRVLCSSNKTALISCINHNDKKIERELGIDLISCYGPLTETCYNKNIRKLRREL